MFGRPLLFVEWKAYKFADVPPFVQLYGKLLHFEDSALGVKSMFNFALQILPGTVFLSLQYLLNFTRYARREAQIEFKRHDKC